MVYGGKPGWRPCIAALLAMLPLAPAHGAARISGLSDVAFGLINSQVDQSNSQNVSICSFQNFSGTLPYSVTAVGSGTGGAFTLSSGAATLAYDVQWSDSANQVSGTLLRAGTATAGFDNAASLFACFGQPDNASLIVSIRAAQLASARAGNYTGTLQITITPE